MLAGIFIVSADIARRRSVLESDNRTRRTIAKRIDAERRLSPRWEGFPIAVNDAYAALCWVASQPEIDPNRIVLAPASVPAAI